MGFSPVCSSATAVFISSDIRADDYVRRTLEAHNYVINSESFIEFSPLDFQYPDHADWLFFSSKNGVKYFFNSEIPQFRDATIHFAAINQGTAQALYELGLKVDFVGSGSNLQRIANDFDAVGFGKIIFPLPDLDSEE